LQALNLLPVGSLDGGRMTRAAYGIVALGLTSVLTYLGLTLGFIGGALSLPFGLFVIIAQRSPERYILDQVSPLKPSAWCSLSLFIYYYLSVPFAVAIEQCCLPCSAICKKSEHFMN
jgi:membrane-associated protease RseP (regulator of RpoE activity)